MSWRVEGRAFHASGPEKENARSPIDVRHLGSRYNVLTAERRPGRVVSDGGNCVGEVRRAHSVMNRMHHGAQFVLDALVYRQPVQLTQGRGRMVMRSEPKYEMRSCVLYAL